MKTPWILLVFFSLLFFSSGFASASLGITPGRKEYNFEPNTVVKIPFTVLSDNPEDKIALSVDGGEYFSKYVSLDKDNVIGATNFGVTINFPGSVEKPGKHVIAVTAAEEPSEENFIGTAIQVAGLIIVFVPYPGRYAELTLDVPDGNIDEKIPVELKVINRGKENLDVAPKIDFYSVDLGKKVYTMEFNPAVINTAQERYFRKYLNTSGFRAGNYLASVSVASSSDAWSINKSFRIGSLFVNLTNYTDVLHNHGIQKFYINLQSKWNGALSPVYVDVNLTNGNNSIAFRTPSADLAPWAVYKVESYVDLPEETILGVYNATFVAFYSGVNTTVFGLVAIEKYYSPYVIYIFVGIALVILVILILWYFLRRRFSSREKH